MKKIIFLILLVSIWNYSLSAQFYFTNPSEIDTIQSVEDTVVIIASQKKVFDYYNQDYIEGFFLFADMFLIPPEVAFKDTSIMFKQELKIHKTDSSGTLNIYYNNSRLFNYRVENNRISGMAYVYLFRQKQPVALAMFENNLLDGLAILNSYDGSAREIAIYKKGDILELLFHKRVTSKRGLKLLNQDVHNIFYTHGVRKS